MTQNAEASNAGSSATFIICCAAVAPLRADASESSEMVSQLLLGEMARLLDRKPRWLLVEGLHDGYEGWISITQASVLKQTDLAVWQAPEAERRSQAFLQQVVRTDQSVNAFSGQQLLIPLGAVLPASFSNHTKKDQQLSADMKFPFGDFKSVSEMLINDGFAQEIITTYAADASRQVMQLLKTALGFMGVPYLWGGRSVLGIDCSGFIQLVLQMCGYRKVPRDASQQVQMSGFNVDKYDITLDNARPGDIIYFSFDGSRVVHVGFHVGKGLLLHASGSVKLEFIDEASYKRFHKSYAFNKRLSDHIYAIQRLNYNAVEKAQN
jgi:cell wall-associated NlpC family hydrolase